MSFMHSNRVFGFFASAVLTSAGLYVFLTSQGSALWPVFIFSGIFFLALTFIAPKALYPLNRAWFLLGEILGRVVSPVVLSVIFFLLLTPIGLLTRLFGRDELRLCIREGKSCWVLREQPEVTPESFKNQY
jgi:hypothetical protein